MPRNIEIRHRLLPFAILALTIAAAGCENWTDPATRLASELEIASRKLGSADGVRYTLVHKEPSKPGECEGRYRVQFNKVGALIVWCFDDEGNTTASGSTTYHSNFLETERDFIVDKQAGTPLQIRLERHGNKAVIVDAS